jgi:MEMO1 family protein
MKKIFNPFVIILLSFYLTGFNRVGTAHADNIHEPVCAGSFYPAKRTELTAFIEKLTHRIKRAQIKYPSQTSLKAIIMPHAGYIYSGWTASHISLVLKEKQFKRIVVMGPDHRVGFQGGAISDVTAYETPLGSIRLNKDAAMLRRHNVLFRAVSASDRLEHSVEVVLPFLQYFIGDFELIPIVFGQNQGIVDKASTALEAMLDQNTLLVASSDLSHYLSYPEAVVRDRETIRMILDLDAEKLVKRENAACGKIPILILINMARGHGWKPVLLNYSNSGDTAGDRSRVVGYAAIAFFGGTSMQNRLNSTQTLSQGQGQCLVRLARQTIAERLGKKSIKIDPASLEDAAFQDHRGTFVTLTINHQLRGCIGNLDSTESLLAGIMRNAVNAAFHDPRFSSLEADELDQVAIEVSILTEPKPLEYRDSEDLLAKLRIDVDGVILRKGSASATFLPQVWEQLPQPEKFLSHLCRKAGLPADTWRKEHLDILTYQVQYFEEEK